MSQVNLHNSTDLTDARLLAMCQDGVRGWAVGKITVRVRYSRGADFSGTCFYSARRIHVNIGGHLTFPYMMQTYLARARADGRRWYKPLFALEFPDGHQLVLFVFMHELYHLLVKRAHRNTRQKESMCDRFAARYLVDRFGVKVRTARGRLVGREEWDYQDLDGFVEAARDRRIKRLSPLPEIEQQAPQPGGQLLLFPA